MNSEKPLRNLLAIGAFAAACAAFGLESGEKIPYANGVGPLFAGMTNKPLGAARLQDGTELLFVQCLGHSAAPGVYVFERIGVADDGAPLFERKGHAALDGAGIGKLSGSVLQMRDGTLLGFWRKKDKLIPSLYDPQARIFYSRGDGLKFSKGANVAVAENADGGLRLYAVLTDGLKYRPEGPGHRDSDYQPFDGAGIWRGQLPHSYLGTCEIKSESSLGAFQQASRTQKEMLLGSATPAAFFDADGKGSLLFGGHTGLVGYYRIGDDGLLGAQTLLKGENGLLFHSPAILAAPLYYEFDGKRGMLLGGECAVYYVPFVKDGEDGAPVCGAPLYARQTNATLYAGSLPVVAAADWDGDGLQDIVAGNSQGEILFFKNVGNSGDPKFADAVRLEAAGEPILRQAGYGGIQGPGESRWGYVGPNVFDWNGDGLPDLLTHDATAHHLVFFNKGTREAPVLDAPRELYCEGMPLHGTWRTRPAVGTLAGKVAYAMLDDDDALHLYWKIDALNLEDGGKLLLENGEQITANFLPAGATGRAKLAWADIDRDGKTDLLIGTPRHGSFPDKKKGLPQSLGLPGAAVLFLKNVGTDEKPVFQRPKMLRSKSDKARGKLTVFGQHECSAAPADFGGGVEGIVVGSEEGDIHFFSYDDILWE